MRTALGDRAVLAILRSVHHGASVTLPDKWAAWWRPRAKERSWWSLQACEMTLSDGWQNAPSMVSFP